MHHWRPNVSRNTWPTKVSYISYPSVICDNSILVEVCDVDNMRTLARSVMMVFLVCCLMLYPLPHIGLSMESQMEFEIEEQEKRDLKRSDKVSSEQMPRTQEGFKHSSVYILEKFLSKSSTIYLVALARLIGLCTLQPDCLSPLL